MKKIVLGILIGALVTAPVSAFAYDIGNNTKWSKPIYRFDRGCPDNTTETTGESCGHVDVFDDQNNKCYIAYSDKKDVSISCVKKDE